MIALLKTMQRSASLLKNVEAVRQLKNFFPLQLYIWYYIGDYMRYIVTAM